MLGPAGADSTRSQTQQCLIPKGLDPVGLNSKGMTPRDHILRGLMPCAIRSCETWYWTTYCGTFDPAKSDDSMWPWNQVPRCLIPSRIWFHRSLRPLGITFQDVWSLWDLIHSGLRPHGIPSCRGRWILNPARPPQKLQRTSHCHQRDNKLFFCTCCYARIVGLSRLEKPTFWGFCLKQT
jgi:hypothetical protein